MFFFFTLSFIYRIISPLNLLSQSFYFYSKLKIAQNIPVILQKVFCQYLTKGKMKINCILPKLDSCKTCLSQGFDTWEMSHSLLTHSLIDEIFIDCITFEKLGTKIYSHMMKITGLGLNPNFAMH